MKILIIEDEKVVSDFFSQLAQAQGHTDIDAVYSGEEALTQVIRKAYDLITLDIQMPGVSGLEIIAMLRNMCPHAVIAIISGYIPEEISSEVASCVDVFLGKPVSIETFKTLLEKTEQIHQTMEEIYLLGTGPPTVR